MLPFKELELGVIGHTGCYYSGQYVIERSDGSGITQFWTELEEWSPVHNDAAIFSLDNANLMREHLAGEMQFGVSILLEELKLRVDEVEQIHNTLENLKGL